MRPLAGEIRIEFKAVAARRVKHEELGGGEPVNGRLAQAGVSVQLDESVRLGAGELHRLDRDGARSMPVIVPQTVVPPAGQASAGERCSGPLCNYLSRPASWSGCGLWVVS